MTQAEKDLWLWKYAKLSQEERDELWMTLGISGLRKLELRIYEDYWKQCRTVAFSGIAAIVFALIILFAKRPLTVVWVGLLFGLMALGIMALSVAYSDEIPASLYAKHGREVVSKKLEQKRKRIRQQAAEVAKRGFTLSGARSYYQACLQHNIPDLETESRRQKALLLAKSKDEWNFPDVETHYMRMFETGKKREAALRDMKARKEEAKRRKKEEQALERKIRNARAREQAAVEWNDSLSGLTGQEKRRRILQRPFDNANKRLNQANAALEAEINRRVFQEGAYLNMDDRRELAKTFGIPDLENKVHKLERPLEELKLKLTDETIPARTLMDALEVSATAGASKSGAVAVDVSVRAKRDFLIADEVKAVIDGGFVGELFQNGESVGSAYIPLPSMGISVKSGQIHLTGYCPTADGNQTYEVRLSPDRLWLIER